MLLKTFLLNKQYKFDFNGNYTINDIEIKDGSFDLINISIDGIDRTCSKKWLGLVSHYEVDLPFNEVLKIRFVNCESRVIKLKCKAIMVIQPPITFDDGFRIIPGFPMFVINKQGSIKSRKTNRILKQRLSAYGYPESTIYDNDKDKWRGICIHILLARAFIPNNDPSNKCFVNHIDGNKLNNSLSNLEWVSSKENNLHAVNNGLRNDNIPCKVHDLDNDTVIVYQSLSRASEEIGIRCKRITRNIGNKIIPSLFLKRYEIKLLNDSSDWFYTNDNRHDKFFLKGPYQALNIKNKSVIEKDTMYSLSLETNVHEDRILWALQTNDLRTYKGYYFRVKSNEAWPETFKAIIPMIARKIIAINIFTNEKIHFNSISHTLQCMGMDKRTLKNRLHSKKPYKDWLFTEENIL